MIFSIGNRIMLYVAVCETLNRSFSTFTSAWQFYIKPNKDKHKRSAIMESGTGGISKGRVARI